MIKGDELDGDVESPGILSNPFYQESLCMQSCHHSCKKSEKRPHEIPFDISSIQVQV